MQTFIHIAREVILNYGYFGIFVLTTAEQFIFPVPADVFLVLGTSMGLLFSKILILILIAAFLGSLIGYFLGKYLGHPVVVWIFGKKNLDRGEKFIKKWGVWGIIVAGLTPIPFKIVTWTAGIFEMPLHKFLFGVLIGRLPRYMITAYAGVLFFQDKFYATTEMSAVILGFFQGITEFLPISSSGHLILMEQFLKLPLGAKDMEIFDIFLHGGSLLAIVIYFWRDWLNVLQELLEMIKTRRIQKNSFAFMLVVGTIPAIIAGLLFNDAVSGTLRNLTSIGILFAAMALFFLYVEWRSKKNQSETVTPTKAILVGLTQALALVPGISRSGITIGAGMLTGLRRDAAAKFSFMLGGVAILAANVYALFSMHAGTAIPGTKFILIGVGTSFIFSFMAIAWLLKFLQRHTLRAFSFYLMLLAIMVLGFLI